MATWSGVGFVRCFVLLIAMVAQSLLASNTWIKLANRDFELYTSLDQKRAGALLRRLEEARQSMEQLSFSAQPERVPLRVFAFRSKSEYGPFRSDKAATAYFLHSGTRNYIVLSGDAVEPVVHEYVHYVLHQRFPHFPMWLDEGLAEVYSTVTRTENSLRLGLPSEDQLAWLRMDGLAYDLPALFRVEQTSFEHTKNLTPRSRFYAESWLLVHMLRLAPEYAPHFNAFLAAIEQGQTAEQAFSRVYAKATPEVMRDLARYLEAERMPTEVMTRVRGDANSTASAVETSSIGESEARAALAGLSAALLGRGATNRASAADLGLAIETSAGN
jgi:hypothetical protein